MSLIENAWNRRKDFVSELLAQNTNAFRLFGGASDGLQGLFIDVFDSVAIVVTYSDIEIEPIADQCLEIPLIKSVYHKKFVEDRSKAVPSSELYDPNPVKGENAPPEFAILENGNRFLIRPYDGFSVGLFLDQRNNRASLGLGGERVLNLFAYTCGFSVAAAARGSDLVSIDVSSKYLDWGRQNFRLNSLDEKKHKFYSDDVFEYLPRAKRRGEKFDLIIMDPPSFSRGEKGRVFSIKKDANSLLEQAEPLLSERGRVFFSSNYSQWKFRPDDAWRVKEVTDLPLDFSLGERPHQAFMLKRDH